MQDAYVTRLVRKSRSKDPFEQAMERKRDGLLAVIRS
jgi:hypothetical protein